MEEKVGRRERKKQLSRQAILDAAVAEFCRKGYKDTSVADIMNGANLGIGTFYNYFSSKEDVLMSLLGPLVQAVGQALGEKRAEGARARELLETGCQVTAAFLDENRFVLPLFLAASEHAAEPEGRAEGQGHMPTPGFKPIFENIIRQGQQAGELRGDVPAELIAEMFHSLYQAAAFSKLEMSFRQNVALKTRLLLDGIEARE